MQSFFIRQEQQIVCGTMTEICSIDSLRFSFILSSVTIATGKHAGIPMVRRLRKDRREDQKGERHKTGILWGVAPYALGKAIHTPFYSST